MNVTLPAPDLRRILVSLDADAHRHSTLEEVARLAAGLKAELVGLWVEDTELLEAAALPMTQIVSSHSGTPAALDKALLQRAFRIWSAESRKAFEAAAERWSVRWSFQVARGALGEQLLSQVRERDLVAFHSGRMLRRSRTAMTAHRVMAQVPCSVLLMEGRRTLGKPVVVLYEGNETTLSVGRCLAEIYKLGISVLALEKDREADGDVAADARRCLRDEAGAIEVRSLADCKAARIKAALQQQDPGVVVFDRHGFSSQAIEQAIEVLGCSILMVG